MRQLLRLCKHTQLQRYRYASHHHLAHPAAAQTCRLRILKPQQAALAEEVQRLEQQQAWLRETFRHVFDEVKQE